MCVCESAARKGTVLAAGAVETRGNQMKPPLPPPIKRAGKAQSGFGVCVCVCVCVCVGGEVCADGAQGTCRLASALEHG